MQFFVIATFSLTSCIAFAHGGKDHANKESPSDKSHSESSADHHESNHLESTKDSLKIEAALKKLSEEYLSKVKPIFLRSCIDCHGESDRLPWYASIPGPKQLINYDVTEAKAHLDMTKDFPFGGHGNPLEDLKAIKKSIEEDTMPPFRYKIMHWDSPFSREEKEIVFEWIDKGISTLEE